MRREEETKTNKGDRVVAVAVVVVGRLMVASMSSALVALERFWCIFADLFCTGRRDTGRSDWLLGRGLPHLYDSFFAWRRERANHRRRSPPRAPTSALRLALLPCIATWHRDHANTEPKPSPQQPKVDYTLRQHVATTVQDCLCGEHPLRYAPPPCLVLVPRFFASPPEAHLSHPGLSEEQISDIFSSAGRVVNFRLVYDRENGKPKGFGFAEYPDAGESVAGHAFGLRCILL